jgi:transglutaminase-like putative cysteine protease
MAAAMRLETITTSSLQALPEGRAGVEETLKQMRLLVRSGKRALPVRMTALTVVQTQGQKDWAGEVRALYAFVRDQVRYVRDIRGVETLHTAEKLLEIRQGDCDDKSILLASLLEAIGHPTRFVAISLIPGKFSHVYVETKIRNSWIPLDATEPVEPGWAPKFYEKLVIHN